ncbi:MULTISPECIES: restriction endonuclease subunit S [Rhizobium]|mgnify:CR=1 FL=1|uniref:Type I restriction-modification system specificity subunit n=1 Tax=Rhizobium johnstonii (strain DSM 114642 / LMG 32736 / 3841) TaxID=216596 RepID=Q1M6T9_RHIJ3|nr:MULTISPECIES: restriction endonuclease subunit S [Rhizobium]NEI90150.1 restriction endonuclease subunit S [Rhizobium leguminosarum]NEJ79873.1 restriction endonuclease subunit S [Rhizobium leguminosarum]WSH11363.1 restriction endonuclease subunit S [Rhizobium johnstonii]CAK03043.1 putative type I restriction-modification system specificity subunit [Rhizobium johnstonii 3841]
MPEIPFVALADLCPPKRSITYGIVQPGKPDDIGVPIVRVNNFRGHRLDLTERLCVAPNVEAQYSRSRPQPYDVLISLVGSIGQVAIAGPEISGWNLARAVGLIPTKDRHHALWIFYALQSPEAQQYIRQHANTTVQATFNLKDLTKFPIPYPARQGREQIIGMLGSLDDKIELNRKMNETLEAIAQAIFRDWFVEFGPTRRKQDGATDPITIMGGLVQDTERAQALADLFPATLGDDSLPEGWESKSLLEQANWINGAAFKNMHFSDAPDALPVVKIAELKNGVTSGTKFTNTALGERYRISDGELLFSWSGNPDTSIDAFVWIGGNAWLNQHIFAVRENGVRSKAALYVLLKALMPQFAELARNKQTTGLGHVTKEDMKRLEIAVAPGPVETAFEAVITPLVDLLVSRLFENRTLAATRDLLLPKLMSGEIRLSGAEGVIEASH